MDADESQEDDEEGDLLEDLKQPMNQRPTALLRALTDLVAKHTAFSSRPAEEDEWIEVSRQKAAETSKSLCVLLILQDQPDRETPKVRVRVQ